MMVGRVWSGLSGLRVVVVAALVASVVVVVAVPVWGLVAGPSSVSSQLGFTQVTPCVVVDSRQAGAGGPFTAPESRDYDVTGTGDFSSQGGSSTGCGIPDGVAGVFFNLKTEHQSGVGRVEVYAAGGSASGAPLVNFDPSSFKDNAGATAMVCQGAACTADFTVDVPGQAGASTQVIVSVLGYFTEALERTIVVNGGGTDSENGAALENALAAVPTTGPYVPSASNPWLIELEPGTFDVGTGGVGLDLPGWVHLTGAGPNASTITCECSLGTVETSGGTTAITAITIANTATDTSADGIRNGTGFVLEVVGSTVTTAGSDGIQNLGTATVRDSHIETTGTGTGADGIRNGTGFVLEVVGSTVMSAEGDGIQNSGTATVQDSHIETTSTANGDGINNATGAVLVVGSTVITAGDDGIQNAGTATVRDSHIETTGTGTNADGILNALLGNVLEVVGSTVITAGDDGIQNSGTATVTNTAITAPDEVSNAGTTTCFAVTYLTAGTFNASSCP